MTDTTDVTGEYTIEEGSTVNGGRTYKVTAGGEEFNLRESPRRDSLAAKAPGGNHSEIEAFQTPVGILVSLDLSGVALEDLMALLAALSILTKDWK